MTTEKCTTCATCKFIGVSYWGHWSDHGGRTHHCLKGDQRRADTMKPTGDFAEDFMRNFRTFFDATAGQKACRYYEEREPLVGDKADLLRSLAAASGKAAYAFFTKENCLATDMCGKFVEENDWARSARTSSDGTRDYVLSAIGRAEVVRSERASHADQQGDGK